MIKIENDEILYHELLVIDSDADKHTCDVIGLESNGNLLYVQEQEFRSGNAYCLRRTFFRIDNDEYLKYLGIAAQNNRLQRFISKNLITFELCYKGEYFEICSDICYFIQNKKCSIFTSNERLAEELHFNITDKFEYEKTIHIKESDAVRITHKDVESGAALIQQEFSTSEIEKWFDTIN